MKTIRRGSSGPDVIEWQLILGVQHDGQFGPLTEAATKQWQANKKLLADGIVGPKTWAAAGLAWEPDEPHPNTKDLADAFFPRLIATAGELGADPLHMLAVMQAESGVYATAHNKNGNASGLIQFMPATLTGLGWSAGHEAFRKLTALEQLVFVRKYFWSYRGKLGSIARVYAATFLPALLDRADDPHYVMVAKGGQLSWAYEPNKGFDRNRDYRITVQELEDAVTRACKGARWREIVSRLEAAQGAAA